MTSSKRVVLAFLMSRAVARLFFMIKSELEKTFFTLLQRKEFKQAEALVKSGRNDLTTWEAGNYLGAIARVSGDTASAEAHFRAAASIDACGVGPLSNLVNLLTEQGRQGEALPYAEKAFKISGSPKHMTAYLGCLLDQAKSTEALEVIASASDEYQKSRDGVLVKVACLRQQGHSAQALEHLDQYLAFSPGDAAAIRMRADTVGEKDSNAALALYEESLRQGAANKQGSRQFATKWNMSLHLLRVRDFKRGWAYYDAGLQPEVGTLGRKLPVNVRSLNLLGFDSELDLAKYTILSAEQGIGDQVLFMSVLQEAIKDGHRILFICEPRLEPIVKRAFPSIETVSQGILEYFEHYKLPINGFMPMGSLMGRYRPTIDSFLVNRKPYLVADRAKYNEFRNILKSSSDGKPVVGISWKGGFWENQQRNKTFDVTYWEQIVRSAGAVVNLQYGNVQEDLNTLRASGVNVINFEKIDFKKDLDTWLALAAACDGIISVSTALVHFAGAIGQKIAVLMPEKQGPWILGIDDRRSIVYPNVYIFRPQSESTLEDLANEVSRIIK